MDHKKLVTASALKYLQTFGVSVIPLGLPVTDDMPEKERIDKMKRPDRAWMQHQERLATVNECRSWRSQNVGLVTGQISGIVVVDCESRADAAWFYKERGKSNTIVQTPRGFHLYFKWPGCYLPNAQRIEGRYDIRGDGGYVVAPPSIVNGQQYKFVEGHSMRPADELPRFEVSWRYPDGMPGFEDTAPGEKPSRPLPQRKVTDGMAYIRTMRAVAGQAGHNVTWKAVCRLKDSGMNEAEALAAMVEWNQTNCDPPWSTAELLHKVKGAYS